MKTRLLLILSIIVAVIAAACNPLTSAGLKLSTVTIDTGVELTSGGARAASGDVSSLRLRVEASDMETFEQVFTESVINLEVEAGVARTFTLDALDAGGNELFSGSTTVDLVAGTSTSVVIAMDYSGFYISFNTNGAASVPRQYVVRGGHATAPAALAKSGYTLAGWYSNAALTSAWNFSSNTVSADMTLYAKWNPLDLTAPVVGGGGTLSFGAFTGSSVDITWAAASDDISSQGSLTYDVYRSFSDNISTVPDCMSNGLKLTASSLIASTGFTASGLSTGVIYYFNVIVSDEAGNRTAYTSSTNGLVQTGSYGYYLAGDGSGGGGAGDYGTNYGRTGLGGNGGGDSDTLFGSAGNDVIFGDGSGGGGGGVPYTVSSGGTGGSGADTISGGAGNDILFGDGFDGEDMAGGDSAASSSSAVGGGDPNGGQGGFGGGGGGGGCYYPIDGHGNGGNGGILAGGGGSQTGAVLGTSIFGGYSGGASSKPAGGSATDDARWGGNSAIPLSSAGFFSQQALGGSGNNAFGAGGGAGFGGQNSLNQPINIGTSTYLYVNGGYPQGGNAAAGTTTQVGWYDSTGSLYTYVSGQLSGIYTTAPGTSYGNGSGQDILNGGGGSDDLFGMGGNDTFVFELNDAGSSDTDTVWDFDRAAETDLLDLQINGTTISSAERDTLIAAQSTSGSDRQIIFTDSVSKTVTIIIKNIGRDLTVSDFTVP